MKKNKWIWSLDLIVILLAVSCLALSVALVFSNIIYLPFVAVLLVAVGTVIVWRINKLRGWIRRLLGSGGTVRSFAQGVISAVKLPMVITSEDIVIWYNKEFKEMVGIDADLPIISLLKLLPGIDPELCSASKGQLLSFEEKQYTAFGGMSRGRPPVFFAIFVEDTDLRYYSEKYHLSRPSVLYFMIDTYEDSLKEMRESEHNRIIAEVDRILEEYICAEDGFIRKLDSWNYIAIVSEEGMRKFVANRFKILNDVAKIEDGNYQIGISGGVGRFGETLSESEKMAAQALDMALGRGGNQVALHDPDGYSFFGGISQAAEKKSKVRSRVMAKTIKRELETAGRVLIMGHKNSDMDSLGACIGMWRFCKMCGKTATIVLDSTNTMATNLFDYLSSSGYSEEFMAPEYAAPLVNDNTLLIIVDTHLPHLVESPALLESCKTVIVIDHHRKMVDHIDDATVFYHDISASSASEMVSEMLQQLAETGKEKVKVPEANALLSGILLDTRVFSLHVGVHTFEAAAFLKSAGAQTEVAKSFFTTNIENYVRRSTLVANAKIYNGFAISVGNEIAENDIDAIAAQSANDLLTITGVRASIVAVQKQGYVQVSARSMGEVNVQLIMEKLGGGGHLTMAAAQLKDVEIENVGYLLEEKIDEYITEHMLKSVSKLI